uniref:NADH dehydrogenase subunit 9 n=1 Tax=Aureoumbra lagunensis TaxID=44058 RepID=A0A7U0QFU1_9STRA|nr:NADH dehydrogenase subunit 9 [Aureoumbra lagunensis]QQW50409.1 NADH dehydrogenase subunit 9 [Aureoumbra lagunensis]
MLKNISLTFCQYLSNKLPVETCHVFSEEIVLFISPQNIPFVLFFLRNHFNCRFEMLSCISCSDFPENKDRFELSYELMSFQFNVRLRVKTRINENNFVFSACHIFSSANWCEREIWDMFGIFFLGHPDLRRILTDYGFEGFPLRKDFPLSGFIEIRFDETKKRVFCEPLELSQEFRTFDFENPWNTQNFE